MTTEARFLCIGDIDVDVLIEVDRLPTRDGKVNGHNPRRVAGGMAGNVSVALARLGVPVRILGRVGDDDEGVFALDGLRRAGVDIGSVVRLSGVRTFSCIGLITPDGEKSLVKLMTAAYRPTAAELTDDAAKGVTHVHLTTVGDPALCGRVVDVARRIGATASLDVERSDCLAAEDGLQAAIQGFDIVFCNAEARAELDGRLDTPLVRLVPTVVTTLGAGGARVEAPEMTVEVDGFNAEVADTTGAGDCFAAACLHARMVQRIAWPDALRFANRAAALSVQGFGAQAALPTFDEVMAALANRA